MRAPQWVTVISSALAGMAARAIAAPAAMACARRRALMSSSRLFLRPWGRCFGLYTAAEVHHPASPAAPPRARSARDRRRQRLEAGGALEHVGGAQQRLLVEGPADELEAERQAIGGEAGRHRDAG